MLENAVKTTLKALGSWDLVAAEVESVRMLAKAVDRAPDDLDLWREFRLALRALREVTSADSDVDENIKDLLARLGNPRVG